ncbi:MAG: hypothetical protein IT423_06905 [Pirellulaceae bacterium]|nr:hypothetical protein [Pirellulaceae bacterium]
MAEAPLIPALWQLPDEFRRRLGSKAGRQRLMQSEGHVLLVLHEVPHADDVTRRGILYWRDAGGEWRASNGAPSKVALEQHLDRYTRRLEEYDQLEQAAQTANQYSQLLEGLAPIVRSLRNLLEVLEEARKAVVEDRGLIDHRDRAYELSRWADLQYDDAKNSMDVAVVRRAEEQASASHRMLVSAHRLNILAALFFPFATLGAIFGTTLTDNWRWSHSWQPFALFLVGGFVCGGLLAAFISREPK